MEKYDKAKLLDDQTFKRLIGVKKETFENMLEILENEYRFIHIKGGAIPKLKVVDKLMITLQYLREYRTMEHISFDYDVSKSTICESIQWVENTLIKDGTFKLPGKKVLLEYNSDIEVILIDVTESEIERPKKNKKNITLEKRKNIP